MRPTRPVLSLLAAAAIASYGLAATAPAAQAADTDVKLNEINHVGTDFVELVNTGTGPVDVSGFRLLDGDPTHVPFSIPAGTSLPAGGRLTFESFGWGLGDGDSVTLFAAGGTTVLDTHSWTAPGAPGSSFGRCPDATGPITVTTAATKGTPNLCTSAAVVKINEIESLGGSPGDWVELKNTGASAVDVAGVQIKDASDANVYTIPTTSIPAGGHLVIEESVLGFGLDDADAVRLFAPGGATVLDSYTWTFPAATTTYGRCADGTGPITKTAAATKGAANSCLVAQPWPGGTAVSVADTAGFFGENMSGLAYEGSGTTAPGTLWAVKNNVGTLYRLVRSGSAWVADSGDWAAGKVLRFPGGVGNVDAEGVTFTDAGAAGGAYVAVERDNGAGGVSRPSVLRFAPGTPGTTLTATHDWNLTADLPGLGPNLGPEAIAWVPDSYLTARGLETTAGTPYDPAAYPGHGTGLFLVGIENTGLVHAYALDHTGGTATRVASFDSGFPAVMELHFERETQQLWVVCDDTCQGRSARFDVAAAGADQGSFVPVAYYERPGGMPNLNNEGFATAPRSECVGGAKPGFWVDDSATGGNALRTGTVSCTVPGDPTITASVAAAAPRSAAGWYRTPVTVAFTCTPPPGSALAGDCPAPVVLTASGRDQSVTRTVTTTDGRSATATVTDLDLDLVAPTVAIKGAEDGRTYGKKRKPRCVGSDDLSGLASCVVRQTRKGKRVTVTATATDLAGGSRTTTLTYRVVRTR